MIKVARALLNQSMIGDLAGRIPGVRALYARHVWRRRMNHFHGVYRDYSEAERAAKRLRPVGWSDPAIADLLVSTKPYCESDTSGEFQPSFYPVFFWISRLLPENGQVVDLGGAGGIAYELARRYKIFPDGARWHVIDVPEMIERGAFRHAADEGRSITFGSNLAGAPAADILLTTGAIQYMTDPLGQENLGILDGISNLPRNIIVNKVPLTKNESFVTIQNLVETASPYNVFNSDAFFQSFERHGYEVVDRWIVPELDVSIPFHSKHAIEHFEGVCFSRKQVERGPA